MGKDKKEAPAKTVAQPVAGKASWSYTGATDDQDLRVDFLRGMVMFVLVVIHIEFFSLYTFLAWERFGVISGGEGFVILSGLVVGMVYRKRIQEKGWRDAVWRLLDRASQLYRINVLVIVVVAVLSLVPFINMKSVMTLSDRATGQVYPLFPPAGTNLQTWIAMTLFLKVGPHQLQILGLYTCLLALTPFGLYLLLMGRARLLLGISWALYFYNWAYPFVPTGCQFEYGYPLLTWQLIFFHGLAAGVHRARVTEFLGSARGRPVLGLSALLFLGFLFFAQNTTNSMVPSYARLSLIPGPIFERIYAGYFLKSSLGILRLLNAACALLVGFALLTRFWVPVHKALGWFFIPIGQASLYVLIVHVFVVALINNFLPFGFPLDHHDLWLNTLGHTLAFAVLWLMVRYRILFRWIPR